MERKFTINKIREAAFFAIGKLPTNAMPSYYAAYCQLFNELDNMETEPELPAGVALRKEGPALGGDERLQIVFTGYGSKLKRLTFDRLADYISKGGTLKQLAETSGGNLTVEDLRKMNHAEKVNYAKWECLADILQTKEAQA